MKLAPWEPDLRTIVDRVDADDIDLQPDFQRQEVWPPAKKKRLIDTILRGWSIPPVFLVVKSDGRMEVLDGQQRLAAIRDFVHNEFTIDGSITPLDTKIKSLNGATYKSLSAQDRRLLDQYTLRCFKITDYSPDEPSELFYRLNQPSMLTAGEQRNAFYGPAREQLKDLVAAFVRGENDKKTIGFSNVRLAYDDIIARLLFFLEEKTFSIKGTEGLISQRFKERKPFPKSVLRRAERAISLFTLSRNEVSVARLNKASALSWLLFFVRFNDFEPNKNFMLDFLNGDDSTLLRNFTAEARRVFQDRASLRVTDVSSVAYRDLALWYVYRYKEAYGPLPDAISKPVLTRIHSALGSRSGETFESVLAVKLNIELWSELS